MVFLNINTTVYINIKLMYVYMSYPHFNIDIHIIIQNRRKKLKETSGKEKKQDRNIQIYTTYALLLYKMMKHKTTALPMYNDETITMLRASGCS